MAIPVRCFAGSALFGALVVGVASRSGGAEAGGAAGWEVGGPVPVAVKGGRTRFAVPTAGQGSRVLVIVSTLAREPGPFAIRLAARAAAGADRPERADDGPARPPVVRGGAAGAARAAEPGMPPGARSFHLMAREGDVAVAGNYRAVAAKLRALGRSVQVYVDERDAARVGTETLREIVATFDERIVPEVGRAIGLAPDVDGDGRFTVLMSGQLARLGGGRLAVDGFVRGSDLDPTMAAPFGNRCDMLYLNAGLTPGPHLRTVLAHEYAHAAVSALKAFAGPGGTRSGTEEEGWLDEAIAHLVEDRLGFSRSNLDYRVAAFLAAPERYRLVVDDYFAAGLFRGHGNRGSTYLFLRWCADRYGPDLIGRLARSPRRGAEALEEATGAGFEGLFRRWTIALAAADGPGGGGDGYRSLDPFGDFGGWPLAGPRMARLAAGGADSWDAEGTSPHFVIVEGGGADAVEVAVEGPARARLQVTAIPLPADAPRLELSLAAAGPASADGAPVVRVGLRECGGAAARVDRLAWEPLVPDPNPHASGFRRGSLAGSALADALGAPDLPALGRLDSRPIPLRGVRAGDGAIVLKILGTDARGRRVAAWAEVDWEKSPVIAGALGAGG